MIKIKQNQLFFLSIIFLSFVYPILFILTLPAATILTPDSINYLNSSSIATPYFHYFLSTLIYFESIFYNDKILLIRYFSIFVYSLAIFLIANYLFISGKKYFSLFTIPILWSVGYFTKYLNYILTDGLSGSLILLSFSLYLNMIVSERKKLLYSLFLFCCFIICFLRPALIIFFIIPLFIIFKKELREKINIFFCMFISLIFFSFYYYFTYNFFSPPKQLGLVIQPLTFNYEIDLNKVPGDLHKDFIAVQDGYKGLILEYNSKINMHDKYIYKMLNNIRITRTGISSLLQKKESELTEDDFLLAEDALRKLALHKIHNQPFRYIKEATINSFSSFNSYGDWYKNSFLPIDQVYESYIRSNNLIDNVSNRHNLDLKKVTKEELQLTSIQVIPFSLLKYNPNIFRVDTLLLILFLGLLFNYIYGIFRKYGAYNNILFGSFIYIASVVSFQNLIFPVIPRLISVIYPITALMLLALIFIFFDIIRDWFIKSKD